MKRFPAVISALAFIPLAGCVTINRPIAYLPAPPTAPSGYAPYPPPPPPPPLPPSSSANGAERNALNLVVTVTGDPRLVRGGKKPDDVRLYFPADGENAAKFNRARDPNYTLYSRLILKRQGKPVADCVNLTPDPETKTALIGIVGPAGNYALEVARLDSSLANGGVQNAACWAIPVRAIKKQAAAAARAKADLDGQAPKP